MDRFIQANRKHWNELTPIHEASEFYDVESFKAGRSTLLPIEVEELGDVSGKTLLHLQCHFGLDTLSWARLGARVTGVDISDDAIKLAKGLSEELGIDADFVRSDVYDLPQNLDGLFDIVYTSYGVLIWLPDIDRWAGVVEKFLKPGGTFYIVEFHPFGHLFDEEVEDGRLELRYPYFNPGEPREWLPDGSGSYADPDAVLNTTTYEWSHSLGDVVTALASTGLRITFLHEFPYSGYKQLPMMTRGEDGWWRLPEKAESVPLMYSIKATKDL